MRKKNAFFSLGILFIVVVSVLVLLEAFLQFNSYRAYLRRYPEKDALFQMVPFLQIKPRPNSSLHLNAAGFRGDPEIDLSADTFRIFTFGGSTTFCISQEYETTYPALVQKILRNRYPNTKIQVFNAACDWYSTQHSIIRLLFDVREYHPQLVIMMHAINDMMRSFAPENMSFPGQQFRNDYTHYLGALATYGVDPDQLGVPFRRLLLPSVLRKDIKKIFTPHTTDILRHDVVSIRIANFKSLPAFKTNLKIFINAARQLGAEVMLLTQPNIFSASLTPEEQSLLYFAMQHMMENYKYPDLESLERGMKSYNNATLQTAAENKVLSVDLDSFVPKNGNYFFDDVHPKPLTMEIEAEAVANQIIASGVIEKWQAQRQPQTPEMVRRS